MSSQEDLSSIIQGASDDLVFNHVDNVALALFAYDTLLTLPSEVQYIWSKKIKLGSGLYLLTRYSALLQLGPQVYLNFATFPSLQVCTSVLYFINALLLLPTIGVQGLLLARAYTIASHKRLVFLVLSLLDITGVTLIIVDVAKNNCMSAPALVTLLGTLNGVFAILFDTGVFAVVLANTYGLLKMQRESDELQRKSMSTLLIQQGVLRYGFVLTLTLASAITDKALRLTLRGILGPFQNTLSIIMICRFHLELQKRNECPNGTKASPSHSTLSTFRAATERIHQSVMDDFGDLEFNESLGAEASNQNELPLTREDSGMKETGDAGPIASSSGTILSE